MDVSTKQTLRDDLSKLGLRPGDAVFVHASMRAIGPVIGGARSIVQALLEQVEDDGLIAMPGFSNDAYWPEGIDSESLSQREIEIIEAAVPGFDVKKSPTAEMGVIAETFRTWPGTFRSAHPTTSVCMLGKDAERFSSVHSLAWACGEKSPFGALYKRESSKVLLVGVGWNRCTALHTAESFAETKRLKTRRFKSDGKWIETSDVADDLGRLFPEVGAAFERKGNVTAGNLGQALCKVADFRKLIDFASTWINAANLESGDLS
ncbi:MAG: AAC(3) family N-acetyltransferase [Pseudomonadota bacterium]